MGSLPVGLEANVRVLDSPQPQQWDRIPGWQRTAGDLCPRCAPPKQWLPGGVGTQYLCRKWAAAR